MDLIVPLRAPACARLDAVGGKAANLHALLAAGLPVPGGFVVTTRAYREATAALAPALTPLFDRLREPSLDAAQLSEVAARIREFVSLIDLPPGFVAELATDYAGLGEHAAVAVRSSATAEDLADASFAGQQDSYLHVVGADAVRDAVHACWASLWTARAVAYRHARGIDPADVALAVVVQRMVETRCAGVMFTADPVSGSRQRLVIDANPGLGEAVVSGEVDPERYVVAADTGRVLERRPGTRTLAVRPRPGGGVQRADLERDDSPVLSASDLAALGDLGRRAQTAFGGPQDTEWAIEPGGRAWLTQSRPVTTLYPLPRSPYPRPGTRVYFNVGLAQGITRPLTPLGRDALKLVAAGGARIVGFDVPDVRLGPPAYAEAGQRPFGDITAALRNPAGRRIAQFVLGYMEARSAQALSALDAHRDEWPDLAPPTGRRAAALGVARALGRMVRIYAVSRLPLHAAQAIVDPDAAVRAVDARVAAARGALALPAEVTASERLDAVEHELSARAPVIMPGVAGYALPGFVTLGVASRLLRGRAAPGALQAVLRGLPHNVTTQMDLELSDLSRRVGADPQLRDLDAFLDQWGDRAVTELDLGMPRWREEPEHLLGALRNYARVDAGRTDPRALFERGRQEAEQAQSELLALARGAVEHAVLRFALDRTRRLVGLRESPKLTLITTLARAREQLLAIGADLASAGVLPGRDDVFFCDVITLRDAIEHGGEPVVGDRVRAVVAANRAEYDAELRRRHIPRMLLSDGTEVETLAPALPGDGRSLTGTPASAGTVTARARVITDPAGAHLEPGEILVAPSTDPGWTPLFLTAGGLVMEMGGSNSHGAVVARECGIPAVVGVRDAASTLVTGQLITVDGGAGVVRLGDEPR